MENAENSEPAGTEEDMSLPAQQQAVCYSLSDEEEQDEEDEISEVEDFASDARKIKERLSTMFEHNDLINNRMAVLTKAIREGPLQPAARGPSRRASMPAGPVPRPSGDFHAPPSVLLERCQQLEQLVRELKQEG
ncbi:CAMK2G [Symbiodinium sp. CCMP2456]|nr:CAMK2G [Symbiodinium sp. CCMP2456]